MTPDLIFTCADVGIEAAADGVKPRRLRIVAYAGGEMSPAGFPNVIIDLAGMSLPSTLPILSDHENTLASIIASGVPSIEGGKLVINAKLASSSAAEQVVSLLASGVGLQASVGCLPIESRRIATKESVTVNGRNFRAGTNGLTVVSRSSLKEVSVTALGADSEVAAQCMRRSRRAEIGSAARGW